MTIQVAMAAAYPPEPEQQWDEGLGKLWQPIPYKAVPLSEDYVSVSCPFIMRWKKRGDIGVAVSSCVRNMIAPKQIERF